MANSPSISRAQLIYAASLLLGIEKSERVNALLKSSSKPELVDLLRARLDSFSRAVGPGWHPELRARDGDDEDGEDAVKLRTARTALAALRVLQRVEQEERASRITDASASPSAPPDGKGKGNAVDADAPPSQIPVFGMRDIKVIQLLAALVARWGLAALVETGILPPEMRDKPASATSDDTASRQGSSSRISLLDEDSDAKKAEALADMTRPVVQHLLLAEPEHNAPQARGEVRTVVLPMLLLPALASLLQLAKDGDTWADQSAVALLAITNPSTSMTALFTLLAPQKGAHGSSRAEIQRRVSSLLSRQLVRPGGVLGLLNVLLGRAESEPPIAQLEQIARLLTLPPAGIAPRDYLGQILPRIMAILRPPPSSRAPPPSYIRALCFCISRLIASSPEVVKELVVPHFALDADDIEGQLDLLAVLIANIDPSPTNYGFLLGSVMDRLFSLWLFLLETKGDPVLREAVENLLTIWGKTLSVEEVAAGVSGVARSGDKYKWQRTASGGVAARSMSIESDATPSLGEEQDLTKLRPDPAQVVTWLKQLDRSSVTAFLLVSWLDEIRTLQAEPDQETDFVIQKAIILRLQLVLKIIEECGSEIVKEAKQTLVFVDHALESRRQEPKKRDKEAGSSRSDRNGLALDDLKIVDSDDEEEDLGTQEEAEFPELDGSGQGDELAVTGLTLLLSILEGNETLSFGNTPILHSIRDKLDHLAQSQTPTISRLARDANMVLSLRRAAAEASTSASGADAGSELAKSRQLYQDALKLLQDPILPVRAQGLSMLRSLVASETALFKTDPALTPAILDIFVQALQDDDSFLYLNAVQGLSGMASSFGKDISQRLMRLYLGKSSDSVGEGESGKRELDNRLRIGEALSQLVQRSARALPAYVEVIVPPLLHVFRTSTLPIALRSSALTILAACAEAAPLSLLPHRETLVDACLDLLSLESRSSRTTAPKDETPDPLTAGSTHPSLRRGAILSISLMLRAAPEQFNARTLSRMKAVFGYLVATDEDPLVRHNAGQVLEDCEALS